MGSNDLRPHLAGGGERRKLIGAAQGFTKGFDPVFLERVLELAYEWALDSQLHVVPMFFVLRVTRPLGSEANPPVKPNLPSTTRTRRCERRLLRSIRHESTG